MTTYVLDITTRQYRMTPPTGSCCSNHIKFYFKIDTNGNVNIKEQRIFSSSGYASDVSAPCDTLIINDNIPIPSNLIEILKNLINNCSDDFYYSHWMSIIETIKGLKQSLKEENNKIIDQIKSLTNDNNQLKKQINNTKEELSNFMIENKKLIYKNNKLTDENSDLKYKIDVVHKTQIDKLNDDNNKLNDDNDNLKVENNNLIQENIKLKDENYIYKRRIMFRDNKI